MQVAVTALLLAAAPERAGAAALVERARALLADGGSVGVLLSGQGLAWATDPRLAGLCTCGVVAVCSQDARAAGWTAAATPANVRWSSVGTWLAAWQGGAPGALWAALP